MVRATFQTPLRRLQERNMDELGQNSVWMNSEHKEPEYNVVMLFVRYARRHNNYFILLYPLTCFYF